MIPCGELIQMKTASRATIPRVRTARDFISERFKEAEVRRREASEIRENRVEITRIHAKPFRESRRVLIHGSRRNPTSRVGIVRTIDSESREFPVGGAAFDGTADDHVVTAPAVIAAEAIARKCAGEITRGEGGDRAAEITAAASDGVDISQGKMQGMDRFAEFCEKIRMWAENDFGMVHRGRTGIVRLIGMGVVATDLDEENLTFHPESAGHLRSTTQLDEPSYHLHLAHEARVERIASIRSGYGGRKAIEPVVRRGRIDLIVQGEGQGFCFLDRIIEHIGVSLGL